MFSVFEDKKGNIWFGTIRGGLYKFDPAAEKEGGPSFTLYTTIDGLADNIIVCMMEDKEGNIWFGTDEGLSRYNADAANGKIFTSFTTDNGLSANSVNAVLQDRNGRIWVGTRGEGGNDLCYFDPSADKQGEKPFTLFKNDDGVVFTNVRSVIEDKSGRIWIGAQNGLFSYDGKSLTNISKRFTGYVFEDKAGTIWTSEEDPKGMALYNYSGSSPEKITVSDQVFGIAEDTEGYIWIGTMNGALRYDPNNTNPEEKSFKRFTE